MRVAVAPVVPSDLPLGVAAVVVADEEVVGVYYARALDVPVEQRCADASAALTAAFEVAIELERGEPDTDPDQDRDSDADDSED
jgi:hypothetical protein